MKSLDQTIAALQFLAEKERKERSKVMFPTSMKVLGVRAENIKKVVDECWSELKNSSPEEWLRFSKKLVKVKILEANQVAFLLIWKKFRN